MVVRPLKPGEASFNNLSSRREGRMPEFRDFYAIYDALGNTPTASTRENRLSEMYHVITDEVKVTAGDAVRREVQRTRDAILAAGESLDDYVFPVVGPGWLGTAVHDEHYHDRDKFNYALASILRLDYQAVIDAGFTLQIDDPALCTRNTVYEPGLDRDAYRKDCEARIEATNWALQGIPEERILYHTCWGSFHTPHTTDLPLDWIIDLLPKVNAGAYFVGSGGCTARAGLSAVGAVQTAGRQELLPGRDRPQNHYRRTSRTGRVPIGALRQPDGSRKRGRQRGLWRGRTLLSRNWLGQTQVAGRRRSPGHPTALGH